MIGRSCGFAVVSSRSATENRLYTHLDVVGVEQEMQGVQWPLSVDAQRMIPEAHADSLAA